VRPPPGGKPIAINDCRGLVRNMDTVDINENYAIRTRNMRYSLAGTLGERRYGTKMRLPSNPTTNHTPQANTVTIVDGITMWDPVTGEEHEIVVGIDSTGATRLWVYDPNLGDSQGDFIELTQKLTATHDGAAIGADDTSATVGEVSKDGNSYGSGKPTQDEYAGYVAVNRADPTYALYIDGCTPGGGSDWEIEFDTRIGSNGLNWSQGFTVDIYTTQFTPLGYDGDNGNDPYIRWGRVEAQRKINLLMGGIPAVQVSAWYDPAWPFRKKITVHATTKVSGSVTNFPMYVRIADTDLNAHALSDGTDILFTLVDGVTKVPHAIKRYSAGNMDAFVNIGSISNAQDEVYYMYYGNPAAADQRDPIGTWSSQYIRAYHMNEQSGFSCIDSLGVVNMIRGKPLFVNPGLGILNPFGPTGQTWAGGSPPDFMDYNPSTLPGGNAARSMSIVVRTDTVDGTFKAACAYGRQDASETNRLFMIARNGATAVFSGYGNDISGGVIQDGVGQWLTFTHDGTFARGYLNGVLVAGPMAKTYNTTLTYGVMGARPSGSGQAEGWIGESEEFRLSDFALDGDYILTNYRSERDPDTFYTMDVQETVGGETGARMRMNTPIRIQKAVDRKYFWNPSVPLITLPEGWYLRPGVGQQETGFTEDGKLDALIECPRAKTSFQLADWLRLDLTLDATGNNLAANTLMYSIIWFTLSYDGYQESEPIFRTYIVDSAQLERLQAVIALYVKAGLMPTTISGLNIYSKSIAITDVDPAVRDQQLSLYGASDVALVYEIPFDQTEAGPQSWTTAGSADEALGYNYFTSYTWDSDKPTTVSLTDALGHEPVLYGRTKPKPQYITRGNRSQKAIQIIDESNGIARTSSYGDLVHFDDVFPDIATDKDGFPHKLEFLGHGELMGLASARGVLYAVRRAEADMVDLQSGQSGLINVDCISKKGILAIEEEGVVAIVGNGGIYVIPSLDKVPLNVEWLNLFNGDLKIDNEQSDTPYITEAYRSAAILGWDTFYKQLWVHCRVNKDTVYGGGTEYLDFIASMRPRKRWEVFKINFGSDTPIRYFSNSTLNNSLTIGFASGILQYPFSDGDYAYTDLVPSDESTNGFGYETEEELNLGNVHSVIQSRIVHGYDMRFIGESVNGQGLLKLEWFANRETTPFATHQMAIDGKMPYYRLPPRGQVDVVRVRISLPAGSLENFRRLVLSSLVPWIMGEEQMKHGNR